MSSNLRLQGKIALVTGAGSGIGRAVALRFAEEGADVLAAIYEPGDEQPLREAAASLPGRLECAQGDVSQASDAEALVAAAVEAFGGLDILSNNAGIVVSGDVTETTEEEWHHVLDVNLKGTFLCCKYAVPPMLARGGGSIVNTASINAVRGNHRLAAYSASKGGVAAMTLATALDYADKGIRVNCVCPATIAGTRMVAKAETLVEDVEAHRRYLLEKHPIGRLGRPEEVAAAILFFASDEASFITGQVLTIDGGRSIR